jgi:hypothetical protein
MGWIGGWHGARTDRRIGMVNTTGICAEDVSWSFPLFRQFIYFKIELRLSVIITIRVWTICPFQGESEFHSWCQNRCCYLLCRDLCDVIMDFLKTWAGRFRNSRCDRNWLLSTLTLPVYRAGSMYPEGLHDLTKVLSTFKIGRRINFGWRL